MTAALWCKSFTAVSHSLTFSACHCHSDSGAIPRNQDGMPGHSRAPCRYTFTTLLIVRSNLSVANLFACEIGGWRQHACRNVTLSVTQVTQGLWSFIIIYTICSPINPYITFKGKYYFCISMKNTYLKKKKKMHVLSSELVDKI